MTIGRIPSVEGGIQPTIVDAKGDLIAGVAADSINRLAVGTNGTVLTADSSTSTGLAWTSVNQMANPVINGAFDIWQRGTSFSFAASTSGFTYFADRWQGGTSTNEACTISRQSVGDSTNLPNIQYCMRWQRNSGQTGTAGMYPSTSIETTNSIPFAGKNVTLTFYARAGANYSASGNALGVNLVTGTGTDQSVQAGFTNQSGIVNSTATLTTTWQRFAFNATVQSTATQLAVFFGFIPTGTAGANDWFEVTGIQIDIGTYTASTAPTFRRSGGTIQGELAACQRYYFRANAASTYPKVISAGGAYYSTTLCFVSVPMPVEMRTAPTLTTGTVGSFNIFSNGSGRACTAIALGNATPNMALLQCTTSAATAGNAGWLETAASTNAFLEFSSEL